MAVLFWVFLGGQVDIFNLYVIFLHGELKFEIVFHKTVTLPSKRFDFIFLNLYQFTFGYDLTS